jgi:YD repeat-containing protein
LTAVRNNTTNALIEGYTYDPRGNRLSKTDGTTTWTFLHDLAHQLTEARLNGVPQVGFTYDLAGNLATRTAGSSCDELPEGPRCRYSGWGAP